MQSGNMSRMYADLLKLQTLYHRQTIKAAIVIVAARSAARQLSYNLANFERLASELVIFENTITVPLLIFGFHGESQ
jgi:hypothetical protein